ncbi:phosphatidylinositol 4-kinase [Vagococcus fluvialis]|uniref:phosphatidylinositol 4-kinase n=1 Tax=Vagococcus fluvialis TaxID=2738 RepID=UPI001D09F457|nr:phosphatidylinositol 4-kinase [Vagococcus fluvialis]UDM74009.1 hypothetical protein K5K99_14065 [Vagococcus fluvialis]
MVDKIYADAHIDGADPKIGQSAPIKIKASDGKNYFLKTEYVDGKHQNAVFFQELLCSLLAVEVGVPVPNFALIEIEKDFLENHGGLVFGQRFRPGLYFGTEEISNVENNLIDNIELGHNEGLPRIKRHWKGYYSEVINSEDYAKIIAFDFFIQNGDRFSNVGNLMVGESEKGDRKVYAIDHGHAFGSCFYDTAKVDLLSKNELGVSYIDWILGAFWNVSGSLHLGTIFIAMENNIMFDSGNPFLDIVDKIESLNKERLIELINEIPTDWIAGGDSQKLAYLSFLCRQKIIVKDIINRMIQLNAFSNHLGGELEWTKEKGTQEESYGIL